MDIQKEREAFEDKFPVPAHWIDFDGLTCKYICKYNAIDDQALKYQARWEAWLAAKAQAVPQWIEYKITSLKDLLNIPVDRIDDCLDELKDGLKLMRAQMAAFEIPAADAVFDSFTWKDDGAKDMTSNAHFSCGGVVQVKVDRND